MDRIKLLFICLTLSIASCLGFSLWLFKTRLDERDMQVAIEASQRASELDHLVSCVIDNSYSVMLDGRQATEDEVELVLSNPDRFLFYINDTDKCVSVLSSTETQQEKYTFVPFIP